MKNLLKKNVRLIVGFIIGVILTGGIVYATTSAREVVYTTEKNAEIKNVESALNDLYRKTTNENNQLKFINHSMFSKTATLTEKGSYYIAVCSYSTLGTSAAAGYTLMTSVTNGTYSEISKKAGGDGYYGRVYSVDSEGNSTVKFNDSTNFVIFKK